MTYEAIVASLRCFRKGEAHVVDLRDSTRRRRIGCTTNRRNHNKCAKSRASDVAYRAEQCDGILAGLSAGQQTGARFVQRDFGISVRTLIIRT